MRFFNCLLGLILMIAGGGYNLSFSCVTPCVASVKPCNIYVGPCSLCPAFPKECTGRPASCLAFEWPQFTKDFVSTRNSVAECNISYKNVANLITEWTQNFGTTQPIPQPAAVNDVLYFPITLSPSGNTTMYAADAISGTTLWQSPQLATGVDAQMQQTPAVGSNAVYFISGNSSTQGLYALNRSNGAILWGPVLLGTSLNRAYSGLVLIEAEDLLIVCLGLASTTPGINQYGQVYGIRASTGAIVWHYQTSGNVTPGQPNTGGSGVGIFGTPAVDTNTGLLYIGTGQNYDLPVTPIADSLVVLNYRTTNPNGQYVWNYQFTNNDVGSNNFCTSGSPSGCTGYPGSSGPVKNWDVDGGPFLLCSKDCNGINHNVVVVASKEGKIYSLDRDTHQLLWTTVLTIPNPTGSIVGGVNATGSTDGDVVYITSFYSNNGFPFISQTDIAVNHAGTGVFAIRASDGKMMWRKDFTGATYAALTLANGLLYFVSSNSSLDNTPAVDAGGILRVMDVRDGSVLYTRVANDVLNPQLAQNIAYYGALVYKGAVYQTFGAASPGGIHKLSLPS